MFNVYVLKSIEYKNRYVGNTDNIEKRLTEHNSGRCRYTQGGRPWKLVYKEIFQTRSEAMVRDKFFKGGQGRKYLDIILKDK